MLKLNNYKSPSNYISKTKSITICRDTEVSIYNRFCGIDSCDAKLFVNVLYVLNMYVTITFKHIHTPWQILKSLNNPLLRSLSKNHNLYRYFIYQ